MLDRVCVNERGENTSSCRRPPLGHAERLICRINRDSLMIHKTRRCVDGKDDDEGDDTYELREK